MSFSDPLDNYNLRVLEHRIKVKQYVKSFETMSTKYKSPKFLNNFYSTFNHFMRDNCLIVVNNFEGVDMHQTIEYPMIFRQFDAGFAHIEYFDSRKNCSKWEIDTVWIPKEMVSRLNGKVSIGRLNDEYFDITEPDCSIIKYLYSFWPADRNSYNCFRLNSTNFVMSSRPWQCEIQIDLFMPDNLLCLGKHTQIFDQLRT